LQGKPLAVDTFANCAPLGRIYLRNGNEVIGAGIVVNTLFGGEENEYFYTHI
jgi:translation elongation factor EF-1alpha